MYRKTGETSIADGVYHSECRCREEIRIHKGEQFPKCSKCQREVGWLFTRFASSGWDPALKPFFPPAAAKADPPEPDTKDPESK